MCQYKYAGQGIAFVVAAHKTPPINVVPQTGAAAAATATTPPRRTRNDVRCRKANPNSFGGSFRNCDFPAFS
jgi:hypothetical protein